MLRDVPEMDYTSNDKDEDGNPMPRGEILVRAKSVIPGYYKNDEAYNKVKLKDGWFCSGDVAMRLPNGSFRIID